MRILNRELMQQTTAFMASLTHADDSAAAHRNPGCTDARQSFESILVGSRRDDVAVEFGRCVEVVVVSRESSFCEKVCLFLREHAQGTAGFHSQSPDASNHFQDLIESGIFRNIAPGRTHAESCRALLPCCRRCGERFADIQKILRRQSRVVMRRLWTVRAVLGTASRFHAEEDAALNLIAPMIFTTVS